MMDGEKSGRSFGTCSSEGNCETSKGYADLNEGEFIDTKSCIRSILR